MASGQYTKIFLKKIRPLSWLQDEKIRTRASLKILFKRDILRFILKNAESSPRIQASVRYQLQNTVNRAYSSKLVNQCFSTGRSHFIQRRTLLARMPLRYYAKLGKLPGFAKFAK